MVDYSQGYESFRKKAYKHCRENVGERILFKGFAHLYLERDAREISPKDLALLTSRLIGELIQKRILVEVKNGDKREDSVYGMFEVMIHDCQTEIKD
jgi:hypothetical protein